MQSRTPPLDCATATQGVQIYGGSPAGRPLMRWQAAPQELIAELQSTIANLREMGEVSDHHVLIGEIDDIVRQIDREIRAA